MVRADAEQSVGYLVKRVQQSLRRRCDATLRSTGLSMAQYAVLRALADHPEASAAELARLCFVTRQSLGEVLAGLRASGMVEPGDGPVRGRARSLRLTTAGRRDLEHADAEVVAVEASMLQGISSAHRGELARWLIKCAQNLETGPGDTELPA
jgi:DNA-binding MarR family transcriptional regulator